MMCVCVCVWSQARIGPEVPSVIWRAKLRERDSFKLDVDRSGVDVFVSRETILSLIGASRLRAGYQNQEGRRLAPGFGA
jgi:hypothetical protein